MLVTAQASDDGYEVFVRRLLDPEGAEVLVSSDHTDSELSKTNAVFVNRVSSLNWPIEASDVPLRPGRWQVEIGVVDSDLSYVRQPALIDVLIKADGNFAAGSLDVALIYTDDLFDDAEVVQAVTEASEQWRGLFAQSGIDIRFQSLESSEHGLAVPAFGEEPRIEQLAAETPARTLNLILSDVISVDGLEILGIAGDIPGPLIPTPLSGVQLSMSQAAGPDGVFDETDTRILAETMAHEASHFLGLFHPVEREGWDHWDSLDDTAACQNERSCETSLGRNLMFPYPICGVGSCTPQDELTDEQSGVLNRALAVR